MVLSQSLSWGCSEDVRGLLSSEGLTGAQWPSLLVVTRTAQPLALWTFRRTVLMTWHPPERVIQERARRTQQCLLWFRQHLVLSLPVTLATLVGVWCSLIPRWWILLHLLHSCYVPVSSFRAGPCSVCSLCIPTPQGSAAFRKKPNDYSGNKHMACRASGPF